MDQNSSDGIAALAVFGIFILPVLGWIVTRYLGHRERMEMIRHGIAPPAKGRSRDFQRSDIPTMPNMPGVAAGRQGRSCDDDFSDASQRIVLRKGIRLTFIGLAITIGLSFIGFSDDGSLGPTWHPGPWLLGGLIPTFIGLSQVVSAMLSGATFGGTNGFAQPHPPPFNPPPFAATPPPYGTPPTYDTSYTYRPGDTQELRPPPTPPERR